jgi:hypothetical protein
MARVHSDKGRGPCMQMAVQTGISIAEHGECKDQGTKVRRLAKIRGYVTG